VFLGITATPGLTIYYATTKKLKKLVNAAICWPVGRFWPLPVPKLQAVLPIA